MILLTEEDIVIQGRIWDICTSRGEDIKLVLKTSFEIPLMNILILVVMMIGYYFYNYE